MPVTQVVYTITVLADDPASAWNPGDSTTYHFSFHPRQPRTAANTREQLHALENLTIRGAMITVHRESTAPSGESVTFDVIVDADGTPTTETIESKAMTGGGGPIIDTFSNSSMSLAATVGESIHVRMVTPAWATNPTGIRLSGYLLVEVTVAGSAEARLASVISDESVDAANILTNDSDISANLAAILTNDSDISALNVGAAAQDSGISDNAASILTNDSDISANVVNITAAQSDADVANAAVLTNDSDISDHLVRILSNDSDISANLVHATRVA